MFKLIVKAQIPVRPDSLHGMPLDIQAAPNNHVHLSCGSFSALISTQDLYDAIRKVQDHDQLERQPQLTPFETVKADAIGAS